MSEGKFETQNRTQMVETTLGLLNAVERGEVMSQRNLAQRLGVALGLTNALVKRCVRKGLLKVKDVPARRFAYYLTPHGFAEKSRLTAEYLTVSLDFFRRARGEYAEAMAECKERGWNRVAIHGAGELAEIALLAAREAGVELVAVIDPTRNISHFHDLPIVRTVQEASNPRQLDAVIVTSVSAPQESYESILKTFPQERVLTPSLLHVSRDAEDRSHGEAAE
ncbi:MAG: winged helix-turn-helix transcriptional regulator [Rhodospirillales bacterium]|nr:winged helix-turn-helix transcriptional regulator [Rhodospirillales bacterium]MCW8862478.1 winged helix-turn-helix transcriptional regulator [Rhodospirillales bacterium]MCW8951579.1 winged helix-turn-helix transcriptional regulator [Rhodospirillales bacterium]MCW8970977.1 winged helix-turn-helix transcriptional regulator [Rhodospirillales bacterium]MCW9002454.1 winged helix-turn-helix transcriptional regulator [Rhodospirillales bacterium]